MGEGIKGIMGAIVGDIAGSRFEFHNCKSKDFEFLVRGVDVEMSRAKEWKRRKTTYERRRKSGLRGGTKDNLGKMLAEGGSLLSSLIDEGFDGRERPCSFTDDSIMTLAVAEAIIRWRLNGDRSCGELSRIAIASMRDFGKRYPRAGYGPAFNHWLHRDNPRPYNSWGNGAAMRVSACGWAGRNLDEVKAMSRAVTEVTHSHPEGIKGAEATSVAVYLARTGKMMDEIREVIDREYYPMNFTLDEIRPKYEFDVSCQGSVPQALESFFESTSFEDAIRNAISIGGDSDTIGAICGAVAGAYYGIPGEIHAKAESFLDKHLLKTCHEFDGIFVE